MNSNNERHSSLIAQRVACGRTKVEFLLNAAYSCGAFGCWQNGQVFVSEAPFADHDIPFDYPLGYTPLSLQNAASIERISATIPVIDPEASAIGANGFFVIKSDSAAFRMPKSPSTRDAAACLLGALILIEHVACVIPPAFHGKDEVVIWLQSVIEQSIDSCIEDVLPVALQLSRDLFGDEPPSRRV